MNKKQLYLAGAAIGSFVGSCIPLLWGASFLSFSSVVLSGVGGFAGIYLAYKMGALL